MKTLEQQLKGGFFLSSMMGITDGAFCARTLEGDHRTAMVQTGAYLAEPSATAEDKGADARCFAGQAGVERYQAQVWKVSQV